MSSDRTEMDKLKERIKKLEKLIMQTNESNTMMALFGLRTDIEATWEYLHRLGSGATTGITDVKEWIKKTADLRRDEILGSITEDAEEEDDEDVEFEKIKEIPINCSVCGIKDHDFIYKNSGFAYNSHGGTRQQCSQNCFDISYAEELKDKYWCKMTEQEMKDYPSAGKWCGDEGCGYCQERASDRYYNEAKGIHEQQAVQGNIEKDQDLNQKI